MNEQSCIPGRFVGAAIAAQTDSTTNTGGDNTFVDNMLDGGWTGPAIDTTRDIDDGIVLSGASNDVVRGNTIRNYWVCGVETAGAIINSTIENNVIEHAGLCGIGGWYASSWRGNTVRNNDASSARYVPRSA